VSFFLVPIIGTGTRADPRRPKYIAALGVDWAMADFIDSAIVWANTTPAQETAVAANADARLVPPLDNTVNFSAAQQALEDLNMPGQWVTAGMTYRTVLRVTVGMAQLLQRASAIVGSNIRPTGNLDRTLGSLSAAMRNALIQACDELGIDRTNITAATTVREALRIFGQQFAQGRTIALGDL
jgi:hypothetical protein